MDRRFVSNPLVTWRAAGFGAYLGVVRIVAAAAAKTQHFCSARLFCSLLSGQWLLTMLFPSSHSFMTAASQDFKNFSSCCVIDRTGWAPAGEVRANHLPAYLQTATIKSQLMLEGLQNKIWRLNKNDQHTLARSTIYVLR